MSALKILGPALPLPHAVEDLHPRPLRNLSFTLTLNEAQRSMCGQRLPTDDNHGHRAATTSGACLG